MSRSLAVAWGVARAVRCAGQATWRPNQDSKRPETNPEMARGAQAVHSYDALPSWVGFDHGGGLVALFRDRVVVQSADA